MTEDRNKSDDQDSEARLEMDFRSAEFPSDALSVRRFRKLFPDHFDGPDRIADGYTNNNFFFPKGDEEPAHLMRLTELICDERTVASGGFYKRYVDRYPEILNDEDFEAIESSKERLAENYQLFKLADGPEGARALVRHVEELGEQQAIAGRSKGR